MKTHRFLVSLLLLGGHLAAFAQVETPVPAGDIAGPVPVTITGPGALVTAPSEVTIKAPGGKATFIGGTRVVLSPGFKAEAGSYFRAYLDLNLANFDSLADSDLDGLPDLWEKLHFGPDLNTTNGSADPDGDGISNADEYRAGTDPRYINEATATINPANIRVVIKTPSGKYQKVLTDWSIATAP